MIKVNGKEVKFEKFPNGETRVVADSISAYAHGANKVDFKYESDNDLIKLMFVKNYLDGKVVSDNIILRVYYMPYSRMDRSENGSPFTLKYTCNFINSLLFRKIFVVEPHSDVTVALLNNAEALYVNFELVERVKQMVGFNDNNDYLVFPDAGANKRYAKMKANRVLTGNKTRNFETGVIESLKLVGDISEASGRTAIIVDDLSAYGTTFVDCEKELRKAGFSKVYLLVGHAENSIFKPHPVTGVKLLDHIDSIFTTDSILTEQNNWENQKYKSQLTIFNVEGIVDSYDN